MLFSFFDKLSIQKHEVRKLISSLLRIGNVDLVECFVFSDNPGKDEKNKGSVRKIDWSGKKLGQGGLKSV